MPLPDARQYSCPTVSDGIPGGSTAYLVACDPANGLAPALDVSQSEALVRRKRMRTDPLSKSREKVRSSLHATC